MGSSSSSDSATASKDAEKQTDAACAKDGLINFKFEPVNRHLRKLFPTPTKTQLMKWIGFITATVNYFVAFGLDIWVAISMFLSGSDPNKAISYAVFSGASIVLAIHEMKKAREIILSDDVSDAVQDIQSRRFYGCISYYHFLLWDKIDGQKTKKDRFFLFIYGNLCNGFRLVFVQTPQLILCFMKMCNSDGCDTDPAIITKTIQLGFSLWALLLTILIYPFLRMYFCCKYGPKFSFGDFCALLFERHVNEVFTPLLEKEDPSALKTLRAQQKEKGKKDKKKTEETPKDPPPEWQTSLIEKGKHVIKNVYSVDALKEVASSSAMSATPSATELV